MATFLSQQWLEQQEMETINVRQHFTQQPKRPVDLSNTLSWPSFAFCVHFFFFFFCLLVASLPHHLHSRWDMSEQMRFAPSVSWNVPVTHAQIKTVQRSTPTVCLQGCQHFFLLFHMHECTTVSKKTQKNHNQFCVWFITCPVLQSGVKSSHWYQTKPIAISFIRPQNQTNKPTSNKNWSCKLGTRLS